MDPSNPLSSHGVLITWCLHVVYLHMAIFYKDISHIKLGAHFSMTHLNYVHPQRTYFQERSHSQVQGASTSKYFFEGDTI